MSLEKDLPPAPQGSDIIALTPDAWEVIRRLLNAVNKMRGTGNIVVQARSTGFEIGNDESPDTSLFWAKLTSFIAISGASNRWQYGWTEVVPCDTDTDPSGFTTLTGGRVSASGTLALNANESYNTGAGVQGDGINVTNLSSGFNLQPAGNTASGVGSVVTMFESVNASDGTLLYRFAAPNLVDGTCGGG